VDLQFYGKDQFIHFKYVRKISLQKGGTFHTYKIRWYSQIHSCVS